MAEPVLWNLDDHTRAKHRVLQAYLKAWIPIMAYQAKKMSAKPRLLLVDGFAGPGRYATGEPGSPLIMLQTLLDHTAFTDFAQVNFIFYFIEHDLRRVDHLRGEIEEMQLPGNVHVDVEHGEFEATFGELVAGIHERGKQLVPTFAFIDPFGYTGASMELAGDFLAFPRCEALYFLPLIYVQRFVAREGQDNAMKTLYGNERWREAEDLEGEERRDFLLSLFEEALSNQGNVAYVRSFALRTKNGQDYRLVFATPHPKGLDVMKRAMWSVDPIEGTRYVAKTDTGQDVLFAPVGEVDTAPLLDHLRATFGNQWFTVEQAREATMLETPFHPSKHLKKLTLKPAETAGHLEVKRPAGSSRGTFTDNVRMRFTPERRS